MTPQALWTLYIHALLLCLSTLLYVYGTQIWGGVCPRELPKAGINIYTPQTGTGVITFPYVYKSLLTITITIFITEMNCVFTNHDYCHVISMMCRYVFSRVV